MKLELSQRSPEVRASLIEAAARVYAAGLIASNSTSADIRRKTAHEDVTDFFGVLETLGEA